MKFRSEKKQAIVMYILEKIGQNTPALSDAVAKTFGISRNTVHTYLNELMVQNIISKSKRGQYALVSTEFVYTLYRSHGDLDTDTHAFDVCLRPHIADLPENARRIWEYAFTEMINNVIDHSEAQTLRVRIVRNYLTVTVWLLDNGVGIFEKIQRHFSLADLDDAICELCKGKLTTDEKNHSGEGIFFTSKMMDVFLIVSGGKIFATTKYENDKVLSEDILPRGTCVVLSLSNFTHKTAADVFNLYSSVDGGFTKTRVPLKNIFDGAPVSRSQAKRVCHRLDQFQEVILDFADVDWMGQGFAHQLFVVFGAAHPQVKLIPENMSDAVADMYRHVMG